MNAILRYKDLVFLVENAPEQSECEYYYEEELCPHDVLLGLLRVRRVGGDVDEHGLFEYVGQTNSDVLTDAEMWMAELTTSSVGQDIVKLKQ